MTSAKLATKKARGKYRDSSVGRRGDLPQNDIMSAGSAQDDNNRARPPQDKKDSRRARGGFRGTPPVKGARRATHHCVYRSVSRVDRLEEEHPGARALIETLLRRHVRLSRIGRQVYQRFGVTVSDHSLSRYYAKRVEPQESAEADAYRQARAQARALIEEMKADPTLDASQIAELMLASQIVQNRSKLADADIMELYREQRERKKLELQRRALLLREKQTRAALERLKGRRKKPLSHEEMVKALRGIYGLPDEPEQVRSQACPERSEQEPEVASH